ncbi:uncharacterized protein [Setaria viridis]|uniref:uncharacterized protein n=1 Tax=Setaria viridis TaxID=4556 RepID=UPI003B3A23D3
MGFKLQQWGVVVRPGETVKCNPGEFCFRVSQIALHAGKGNGDVRIFVKVDDKEILLGTLSDDKSGSSTEEDDKSKDTESGSEKLAALNPVATQSSTLEEKKDPEKLQKNVGASDDDESDEDYVDSEEGESNDNE